MARSRANLAEGMQCGGPRRPKEAVPRVGPKPHDAGNATFQVAEFHRAPQRAEISAERAQPGAIVRARVERRDQEDRGAGERRGYRLRNRGQSSSRSGRAHCIGMGIGRHGVSSRLTRTDFALQNATLASRVRVCPASLPSAAKAAIASPPDPPVATIRNAGFIGLKDCCLIRVIVSRIVDRTIQSPNGPSAVTCVDVPGLRDDNRLKNSLSTPAQMWMPPTAASQIKISSMNISQATSGQHIPARKANRSPPIPFAPCAIFLNVMTLLNSSTAEQIPKDQTSNNPSVASCGFG